MFAFCTYSYCFDEGWTSQLYLRNLKVRRNFVWKEIQMLLILNMTNLYRSAQKVIISPLTLTPLTLLSIEYWRVVNKYSRTVKTLKYTVI